MSAEQQYAFSTNTLSLRQSPDFKLLILSSYQKKETFHKSEPKEGQVLPFSKRGPFYQRGRERFSLQERPIEVPEDKLFLLPGTGFDVRGQSNMWIRGLRKGFIDGIPFSWILNDLRIKTKEDIKTADDELIKQDKVFHSILVKDSVSGDLLCPRYNNASYLETISAQERQGKVKETAQRVQYLLVGKDKKGRDFLKDGDILIIKSPVGKSGLPDRRGGEIEYTDSYITLFQKYQGIIRHVILRTDLSLEQIEVLQRLLEVSKDRPLGQDLDKQLVRAQALSLRMLPEEERVQRSVSEIAILRTKRRCMRSFEEVVTLIEKVLGTPHICRDTTFAEIKSQLKKTDEMLNPDVTAQFFLDRFDHFIDKEIAHLSYGSINDAIIDRLEEKLGKTVLGLYKVRKQGIRVSEIEDIDSGTLLRGDADYSQDLFSDKELEKGLGGLQSAGGCNGGGGGRGASTFGGGQSSSAEGGAECQKIKCGRLKPKPCPWEATDQDAELINRGELTCCPKCEWYPGKPDEPSVDLTEEVA